MAATLVGLQLGALVVVLQTVASGISSLPLQAFLWLMLPLHGSIGLVEGLATAAILGFIRQAQPALLTAVCQALVRRERLVLRGRPLERGAAAMQGKGSGRCGLLRAGRTLAAAIAGRARGRTTP